MTEASPLASASAAGTGAVAAQRIPPPAVDSHRSWLVPKWAWKAAASSWSGTPGPSMTPSTSSGRRPASASARSTAVAAISVGVRPDARLCSDSPTPTMATFPPTSSRGTFVPQSSLMAGSCVEGSIADHGGVA